jgi:hypothetical protein
VADDTVTVKVTGWPNMDEVCEGEIVSEVPVSACAPPNDATTIALASANPPSTRDVLRRTYKIANTYPRSAPATAARPMCQIVFTRERRPQPNHAGRTYIETARRGVAQ